MFWRHAVDAERAARRREARRVVSTAGRSCEAWRHTSVVSPVAEVVICGAGGLGYDLAVDAAVGILEQRTG